MLRGLRAWQPVLFIILGVVAANVVNVLLVNPDPALQKSGLVTDVVPGLISGLNTIDPFVGYVSQALGAAAADQWLSGTIPWWNSLEGIGAPLAGGVQATVFFPFVLLTTLPAGMLIMHLLLEVGAGLATYLLLRKLGLGRSVGAMGGLAFALNGTFAWLSNAIVNPIAFLPLLLLGLEYARDKTASKQRGGWVVVALAIIGSAYAGFPEVAALNALFALVWFVARNKGLDWPQRRRYVSKALIGGLAGALVSLLALMPFISYYPDANVGMHATELTGSLPAFGVSGLVFPYIFGPIFGFADPAVSQWWGGAGGFITLLLVLLAIAGLWHRRHRALKIALLTWILVMVARIYGMPGIAEVFNIIPGMSGIYVQRYAFPAVEMAIIVLAAFGMQDIITNKISAKRLVLSVVLALSVAGAVLLIAWSQMRQLMTTAPNYDLWLVFSVAWGLGAAAAMLAVACFRNDQWRRSGVLLVVAADVLVMFMVPQLSAPHGGTVDTAPVGYLKQNLGLQRFFTLGPIAPNYGSYFGIASINTNNLPVPAQWSDHITKELDPHASPSIHFTGDRLPAKDIPSSLDVFLQNIQAYEAVGTKYVVAHPGQIGKSAADQADIKKVFSNKTADIFLLPNPAPYYEVVGGVCKLKSQERHRAVVDCDRSSQLVRREMYLPGWEAAAQGTYLQVNPHKDIFQTVSVPKGESSITFAYKPPYIGLAIASTALGVVMIGYGIAVNRRKRSS